MIIANEQTKTETKTIPLEGNFKVKTMPINDRYGALPSVYHKGERFFKKIHEECKAEKGDFRLLAFMEKRKSVKMARIAISPIDGPSAGREGHYKQTQELIIVKNSGYRTEDVFKRFALFPNEEKNKLFYINDPMEHSRMNHVFRMDMNYEIPTRPDFLILNPCAGRYPNEELSNFLMKNIANIIFKDVFYQLLFPSSKAHNAHVFRQNENFILILTNLEGTDNTLEDLKLHMRMGRAISQDIGDWEFALGLPGNVERPETYTKSYIYTLDVNHLSTKAKTATNDQLMKVLRDMKEKRLKEQEEAQKAEEEKRSSKNKPFMKSFEEMQAASIFFRKRI